MSTDDVLPTRLRRSLIHLGSGLNIARRRRRLTVAMMAESALGSLGRPTVGWRRVTRTVAMGTYLMAMFVLGLDWGGLEKAAEPQVDDMGTALQLAGAHEKVRAKRTPQPK